MTAPADLVLQSMGAGVQSTALLLLSAEGRLPRLDGAIFADTGWEPRAVYEHLDRLEHEVMVPAGIPLHRVAKGNLRQDTIDPVHRYASVPYFVLNHHEVKVPIATSAYTCLRCRGTGWADAQLREGLNARAWAEKHPDNGGGGACPVCGSAGVLYREYRTERRRVEGMGRRQCTSEYKLTPIARKVRELLGAAPPDFKRVPRGRRVDQWIGFSADEVHRISDTEDGRRKSRPVSYVRKLYPLLDLERPDGRMGWTRTDCERYLRAKGWGHTVKSACIGCPYHGNRQWRDMRDNRPEEWADAVAFDHAIRKGGARGLPLDGEAFLHRSRVPLEEAPIDRRTSREWDAAQVDLLDLIEEEGDPDGCSPYGCRSGAAVA